MIVCQKFCVTESLQTVGCSNLGFLKNPQTQNHNHKILFFSLLIGLIALTILSFKNVVPV